MFRTFGNRFIPNKIMIFPALEQGQSIYEDECFARAQYSVIKVIITQFRWLEISVELRTQSSYFIFEDKALFYWPGTFVNKQPLVVKKRINMVIYMKAISTPSYPKEGQKS